MANVREALIALAAALHEEFKENNFNPTSMDDIYQALDGYQIEDETASLIASIYQITD